MDDVQPLSLSEDDFFSDMGGDEPDIRNASVGTGSRLVISVDNNEMLPRSPRTNPFGGTEIRSRINTTTHHNNNSSIDHNNSGGANNSSNSGSVASNGAGTEILMEKPLGHSTIPKISGAVLNNHNNVEVTTTTNNHYSSATGGATNGSHSLNGVSSHCHVPHEHEKDNTVRNQLIAISIFTTAFGCGEVVGAVFSKSIAIGTDVMHLCSDLLSFIISLCAVYLAKRHPTARLPWGFHRAEVLGALLSVFIIWVVTGVLVYLAAQRVYNKTYGDIDPDKMLYTSIAGVVFNIIMAVVLNVDIFKCKVSHGHSHGGDGHGHSHRATGQRHSHGHLPLSQRRNGEYEQLTTNEDDADVDDSSTANDANSNREKNIVIRAAFVHVIGDLVQSIGVLVAALIIKFKGADDHSLYRLADPICTFTFSVLVLITTLTVIRDAFFILMEGAPSKVDYDEVHTQLLELEGVRSVHSLKIWSLTSNEVNASVHLAVDAGHPFPFELVSKANKILRGGDIVNRCSVQIELYDEVNAKLCTQCLHPRPSTQSLVI